MYLPFFRYLKTREQEDVDYVTNNGINVGHEMRYRTDNTEMERYHRQRGVDDEDIKRVGDSLSAGARRRSSNNNATRAPLKYRGE